MPKMKTKSSAKKRFKITLPARSWQLPPASAMA